VASPDVEPLASFFVETPEGERWVEARASDEDAAARW